MDTKMDRLRAARDKFGPMPESHDAQLEYIRKCDEFVTEGKTSQYHQNVVKEMHALADLGVAKPAAKLSTFTSSLVMGTIQDCERDGASVTTCCDILLDLGA